MSPAVLIQLAGEILHRKLHRCFSDARQRDIRDLLASVTASDKPENFQLSRRQRLLHSIRLEVIKHTEARRGFARFSRRWVVKRSFGWTASFRRLARDYGRLVETLATLHDLTLAILRLAKRPQTPTESE